MSSEQDFGRECMIFLIFDSKKMAKYLGEKTLN